MALAGDRLHPLAAEALAGDRARGRDRGQPYRSIVARAVELLHAFAEAADIVDAYGRPDEPGPLGARRRHRRLGDRGPARPPLPRYELDERGLVDHAQIVPPTSQNQAAIEADLARVRAERPRPAARGGDHRIEQLIRSYDPCISCATHFLDLRVERAVADQVRAALPARSSSRPAAGALSPSRSSSAAGRGSRRRRRADRAARLLSRGQPVGRRHGCALLGQLDVDDLRWVPAEEPS